MGEASRCTPSPGSGPGPGRTTGASHKETKNSYSKLKPPLPIKSLMSSKYKRRKALRILRFSEGSLAYFVIQKLPSDKRLKLVYCVWGFYVNLSYLRLMVHLISLNVYTYSKLLRICTVIL